MTDARETVSLGEERDRLDDKVDELADLIHEAEQEDGESSTEALRHHANQLAAQGRGVAYLIDEYGEDAEITVEGLNAGQYAMVDDRVAMYRQKNRSGAAPGSQRNVFAAAGLVEAPFYDGDGFDDAIDAVGRQPVDVAKYLEAKVNSLTTVDQGNWTPLRERLKERQTE